MPIEWVVIAALLLTGASYGVGLHVLRLRRDIGNLNRQNSDLACDLRRSRESNLVLAAKIAEQAGQIMTRDKGGRFQKSAGAAPDATKIQKGPTT